MLHSLVTAMRRSTRQALAATRTARCDQARRIRSRLRAHRLTMLVAVRALLAPAAVPIPPECSSDEVLQARILDAVEGHPEGVAARELGNELGIDWRRAIAAANALVLKGAVDRIGQAFYAAGKASRRC